MAGETLIWKLSGTFEITEMELGVGTEVGTTVVVVTGGRVVVVVVVVVVVGRRRCCAPAGLTVANANAVAVLNSTTAAERRTCFNCNIRIRSPLSIGGRAIERART